MLDSGPLHFAVRASNSPAGIFPPTLKQGHLLVDGAILNNVPVDAMRDRVGSGQVIAVDVRSPLHFEEHADFHERLVMRKVYPLGQYLKAFDFAVCAAGYNTFHENIAAALPSIFIPNSNPIMDVQEARAEYGARAGWNLTSPAEDPYAIGEQLVQMLDPDFRQSLARSCLRKSGWWNGAQQTAHLLQAVAQLPANPLEER